MSNKEFAIWCLAFFIGFVWILVVRTLRVHPFLEINLELWICCAAMILAHDAIVELRKKHGIQLKHLL